MIRVFCEAHSRLARLSSQIFRSAGTRSVSRGISSLGYTSLLLWLRLALIGVVPTRVGVKSHPLLFLWQFALNPRMTKKAEFPSDLADRFQVRMPPGLRDRIAAAAKTNSRSMNAEIVARLEASFEISIDDYRADTNRLEVLIKQNEALMAQMQKLMDKLDQ